MLAAADRLAPTSTSPLRPAVMRLAVVLLYTAGLRRGELLRLSLADVDPRHGILHIRESKFHKARIVPLSPDAARSWGRTSGSGFGHL
ncbi:tyrosine-type recombinase/integrase [Bradyrhizobium australiense]|uniref:tyrosine-type recombinase/integrase n=1 Tax=Bradyrhizobium australiense TaxID=2721161 RepID=UPI001AEDEC94